MSHTHTRHYHVVRHIVTYGEKGPRHRTVRELTLIRTEGKPCLPNGIEVQLSKKQFNAFKMRCRHDGQVIRFTDAVVSHTSAGNWKIAHNPPAVFDGTMHLFDSYPLHDVSVVQVTGITPKRQAVETALTSNGDIPVFYTEFGRGSCLFAPVRFGFVAEVGLNGAPERFEIHATTELTKPKNKKPARLHVRCGRDAMEWLHLTNEPVAA